MYGAGAYDGAYDGAYAGVYAGSLYAVSTENLSYKKLKGSIDIQFYKK